MVYPSVNLKQLCIIIHAIQNVLTIKACVKEQFLFNDAVPTLA